MAFVAARLKRDIGRCPTCPLPGLFQCIDFGMWLARTFMPTLANDATIAHDHATYQRIRFNRALARYNL